MRKRVLYSNKARAKILDGVNKITDAVVTTLGPSGRNVLIADSIVIDYAERNLPIHITKDGVTVAKSFEVDDRFESAGVTMAKECADKTVLQCGDGTTTSILFFRAIVKKGVELIDGGANPMEIKKGIDKAVEYVVSELEKMAIPIKGDLERIRQIATVSANNDSEIGDWIAKAFEKIGDYGVIDLDASKGTKTEIKLVDGYKWNNGWISPYFITNTEKKTVEYNDPLILLYEKRITHHKQIMTAVQIAQQAGRPLLIICEDADEEGLAFLAKNNIAKTAIVCAVKSPAFGDERRTEMEDLAILTHATYISSTKGILIEKVTSKHFGNAKKVIVSKDETVIIGGDANTVELENLMNELRMNLAQAKNEDEKAPIEKRIAKLTGSVAVIEVGAATETEMKEKLDRFDDAVRATKAAIAEGFVPGGGTAFLNVPQKSDSIGWDIVMGIMEEPLRQICKNAGVNSDDILIDVNSRSDNFGYNAKTDVVEDLILAGIIDPVKVLRCALQNAASSAGMILTSEVLIVDFLN